MASGIEEGGASESRPIGGRDYPRNLPEFNRFFSDEAACEAYLQKLRWPEGFVCPACANHGGWKTKRSLWVCGNCQRQTSLSAGTIFAGTRTPLLSWFCCDLPAGQPKARDERDGLQEADGSRLL